MIGYTKLFGSLLASTIWREDDKVRIVWITLLAMADKRGIAEGSIPGIADLARVSIEDCERALDRLQQPDRFSRSTDPEPRQVSRSHVRRRAPRVSPKVDRGASTGRIL